MPSYTTPRVVEIILHDDDGTKRHAVATKRLGNNSNVAHWDLSLRHPSGESWPAQYSGGGIIDAMAELVERKEFEFNRSRSRGHKPHPMLPDRNVPINDGGNPMRADVMMSGRDSRYKGR
jgi:hypothetical protein